MTLNVKFVWSPLFRKSDRAATVIKRQLQDVTVAAAAASTEAVASGAPLAAAHTRTFCLHVRRPNCGATCTCRDVPARLPLPRRV